MDIVTYAILNGQIDSAVSGIADIGMSADKTKLVFTLNDGTTRELSVDGLHTHSNLDDILEKFTVVNGELYFDGKKVTNENVDLSDYYKKEEVDNRLNEKVDKVVGKTLTSNDFTDDYKTKLDDLETNLDKKVDKETGKSLIEDTVLTKIDTHLKDTTSHLTKNEKEKLDELGKQTETTTDAEGNKTVKTNGVTSIYDKNGNITSTTFGGVKVNYKDGAVESTKINNLEVKKNNDGSSSLGDLKLSKDENGNIFADDKPITNQTTTTTTETGNTITTITNGNIKSVTEKDNTGKVVSDKVLVNDRDLSEIIQDGSEWASKEDVNSVLSDTYNELGW